MQTRGTTALSSTEWGFHRYTSDYHRLTPTHYARIWYRDEDCWVWMIYTHEGYKDPYGSHEAEGHAIDKETATKAVEALLEIMK